MNEVIENSTPAIHERIRERGALRTYIEYAIAWTMLKGLGALPRTAAIRFAQAVGALARTLRPRLSRHAEVNLRLAFPDLDERERERIVRGVFSNLGRLLGEISQFPRFNRDNISSIVVYEGLANFLAARDEGRGAAYADKAKGAAYRMKATPDLLPLRERRTTRGGMMRSTNYA